MSKKNTSRKTIYYDGDCAMCTAFASKISSAKRSDQFILKNIAADELPKDVTLVNAQKEIYVTTASGTLVKGIDGIIEILKTFGFFGKFAGVVLSIPGIHFIAKKGYAFVAKYRYIFFRKKM